MSFELPTNQDKKERQPAVDEQWFDMFERIGSFQDFEYLEGDKKFRENQKNLFLNEQVRNPELDYPKLEKFDLEGREEELLKLKKNILENETNETVQKTYRWKINQKIAEVRMLKASKNGDPRSFARYSSFIYGEPDKDVFQFDLEEIAEAIKEKENSDDFRVLFAIRRLKESLNLDTLSESSGIEKEFLPHKKRILQYPFEASKKYNAQEIRNEFSEAMDELGVEGWQVLVDENIKAISVSQEKKNVRIPENKKLTSLELKKLIAHEIKTHVLRRESGERSKLKLLGLGLDRYLLGEEGISAFEEQSIGGSDSFAGFDGHLAISLAVGLDGNKRDFRDVFNILRDFFFIRSKSKDLQKSWENAKVGAWNRCVRTFRGTNCSEKGACLTRDIVYREGNINTWIVIKGNDREELKFSVGKYDPANPRHIWILEQLGISDDDLVQTLDK
ncbi:MAG TPA: hypothetical protein DEA43_04010 [Candidatus Moranbacteria bacterium]|nr:hypothetical protein [Candidatus Moranbacteria bacterium]HBT46019.1 hypothetical protein [Candidatus Moranbacteria bacterium]